MCPNRLPSRPSGRPAGRPRSAYAVALLALVLASGLALPPAHAGERAHHGRDHERALEAVKAGKVLPLSVLLERLQRSHPGEVLELELESEHGRWLYEIKLLEPGGRVVKLEVDAQTGQVLRLRRKGPAEKPPETTPETTQKAPPGPAAR